MSVRRWSRRRVFLAVAGTGMAVAAAPALVGSRPDPDAAARLLRRIVARHASYLEFEPVSFELFVVDYLRDSRWRLEAALARMRAPWLYGHGRLDGLAAGAEGGGALEAVERHLVTALLLGCGFFGPDRTASSRPVVYSGWERACANPFARRRRSP